MHEEVLQRYQVDQDPHSRERLIAAYRPLVYSVCRRYLRRPQDIEDAVQETFVRFLRHCEGLSSPIAAWLTATAYSASIDLIRATTREQRRRHTLADMRRSPLEHRLLHEAIQQRLGEALLALDEPSRQLIIERFFRKTPLRILAGQAQTSLGTVSRRVSKAMGDLAAVLRDMGIQSADDLTLAEHFGGLANIPDAGLRFAPDWQAPAFAPPDQQTLSLNATCLPGWSRPLRIGVLVSYASDRTVSYGGSRCVVEMQVLTTQLLRHAGLQFVGIAEPGTTKHGQIERTLRDHDLTGGLIDSTDAESLRTLDVILLGLQYAMPAATAAAFVDAVRSGVGLLNEFWTGLPTTGDAALPLMLADSPIYSFHIDPCGWCLPATVLQAHPVLPGLQAGRSLRVYGCGPVYRVRPDAQVLIAKDLVVPPERHQIPGLGPARMPYYIVGQLGRGRVVVIQELYHQVISEHPAVSSDYFVNLLSWLAEPRREGVGDSGKTRFD